jgi:hypothetical protein
VREVEKCSMQNEHHMEKLGGKEGDMAYLKD